MNPNVQLLIDAIPNESLLSRGPVADHALRQA
jgi:hypothetical protein